ncbi:hypothetical protein E2562_022878 [Oryza meyeriana var. granulata]|uniref:Uncharacterized protein n=1 Tax=Oryza meyeriana var. granulata TaxID=110450 RepID=A0A6G1D6I9_9ORYZ|nr:hypothetical protein E2562_022878 [Oryza meyeriana var. granulata]KAF0907979.1 hypothetical protein E2562_022878 [Oryza meyeriana var. granulata]
MFITIVLYESSLCSLMTNLSSDQIDASKPIPEVFEDVKTIFAPYAKMDVRPPCILHTH